MIKLFADGADVEGIVKASYDPRISGFTTNPTLMRQAGITDYEKFARNIISVLKHRRPDTCLSLEVFADDFAEMRRQARTISDWGDEYDYPVYVKIPAMNTKGSSTDGLVRDLANEGILVNVTAVFTPLQIQQFVLAASDTIPMIISVFAGRIADTGVDPVSIISAGREFRDAHARDPELIELLWASPREVYNYKQAETCCDIITMTPALIDKMRSFGKSLTDFSRETVEMFYNDSVASGFTI